MRKAACILLPLLLLSGCGIGSALKKTGQVLLNPSIQVGSNDDQPTQVALSLYADHDVNPNGQYQVPDLDAQDAGLNDDDGPYTVRFVSDNKPALINNLYRLLEHLQTDVDPTGFVAVPATAALSGPQGIALRAPLPATADIADPPDAAPVGQADEAEDSDEPELGQYDAHGQRRSFAPSTAQAAPAKAPGTPVAFKLVQLKDDSLLLNADPDQLRKELKKVLGSTYLDADDYLLLPGQFKFVPFRDIRSDTRFLAVIAYFHDANAVAWKEIIPLEPKGHKYSLLVMLRGTRVSITDERRPATASVSALTPVSVACPVPPARTRKRPASRPSAPSFPPLPAASSLPGLPPLSALPHTQATP